MNKPHGLLVLLLAAVAGPVTARAADPTATLEVPADLALRDAVRLSLAAHPGLQSRAWEVRKAEARTRQAAARPNPELSLDVEDWGGARSGVDRAEATLSIGQTLELGGKRSARLGAARADQGVASLDADGERLVLIGEVTARYLEALATDRSLALSEEEVHAAEEAATTAAQRVTAGASHPVERRRADVELANLRLERTILQADARLARSRLSSLWGEPEPRFDRLRGSLEVLPALPSLDSLAGRADGSPALARWRAEREARERRLALERSRRIPDLEARAGIRRLAEPEGHAFVAGVSVPLPLFDRNRGAIDEAAAALAQMPSAQANARLDVHRALAEGHATLRRATVKLAALRREVLPEAQRAFEEMRLGFERGRFSYLDLLEARRTWLRARREELQTLLVAHLAVAELERLVGAPLEANGHREGGLDR